MTSNLFHKIEKCRVCGNPNLVEVLDLEINISLVSFLMKLMRKCQESSLKLVKCDEEHDGACGHVQLEHTFDLPTMYGQNYGYRSGLNSGMVKHLKKNQKKLKIKLN